MSLHSQRDRASSFGADPERYDRARPSYPDALIEHLLGLVAGGEDPVRVLDVGCGTGIASRRFTAAGAEVLGVEPDERMAEVARARGTDVEVADFETWEPGGRTFDLVVAGQAWHWVDPEVGPHRAADVLRSGGVLAPFWNLGSHGDAQEAFGRIYEELGPTPGPNPSVGGRRDGGAGHRAAMERTGRYTSVDEIEFPWEQTYSRDEWLDQLPSHSDHRLMAEEDRQRLLDAVGDLIDDLGGYLTMSYECVAIVARRR